MVLEGQHPVKERKWLAQQLEQQIEIHIMNSPRKESTLGAG